ncbi:MAG: putative two-component system response regulator [Idiomarinaceae bacterium HL-53]|nr:MAG: putative two-component system response regulator [Idiomarinaceae bacterium HL-53]CUS47951.1 HD domain-containing protein [Idiomarinaceae bacterium HL-53]
MRKWLQKFEPKPAVEPAELTKELFASLMVMAWFVEAKDPYTGGHLWRVSEYARKLAAAGKLPPADVARIALGGFLHDLGKIAVSDQVLRKTGKLNDREYEEIKTHPEAGGRMLAGHPLANLVGAAVELHHERPDGKGYPHGLNSSMIPVDSVIVGICDAFDAMTSQRPYRKPMTKERACNIIAENLDSQFNRFWGELFIHEVQQGTFDTVLGHSQEGIPLHHCKSCGPVVVQRSDQQAGDFIYCPVCSREMRLHEMDSHAHAANCATAFTAKPTGKKGTAIDLEPKADRTLIRSMIERSVAALPPELLALKN